MHPALRLVPSPQPRPPGKAGRTLQSLSVSTQHRMLLAHAGVELKLANPESDTALQELVARSPEVQECYMVAGAIDFLLKVRVPSMAAMLILMAAGR